jgi:hypothetical protein
MCIHGVCLYCFQQKENFKFFFGNPDGILFLTFGEYQPKFHFFLRWSKVTEDLEKLSVTAQLKKHRQRNFSRVSKKIHLELALSIALPPA